MAPNYLPQWLAIKYPYAQETHTRTVVFKTSSGNTFAANDYTFSNGKWTPFPTQLDQTEQYVFAGWSNKGWMFDPTVYYTMVNSDYQIMVDYVLNHPTLYVYNRPPYVNEEWYYGFNAYYGNMGFRLSGSPTSSRDIPCSQTYDTELHALSTPQEQIALLWNRLSTEGMVKFLQLRFPDAVAEVSGIPVHYYITALIYCPDGTTASGSQDYVFAYRTLTSGSPGNPPTFEFISREPK